MVGEIGRMGRISLQGAKNFMFHAVGVERQMHSGSYSGNSNRLNKVV